MRPALAALLLLLALSWPAQAALLPPGDDSGEPVAADACAGLAPLLTSCATGTHNYHDGLVLGAHQADYTGNIVAVVVWQTGQVLVHACGFDAGNALGCSDQGGLGPPDVKFTHACASDDLGTAQEGGSGAWACELITEGDVTVPHPQPTHPGDILHPGPVAHQ